MNNRQKLVLCVTKRLLIALGAMVAVCIVVIVVFLVSGLRIAGVPLVMIFGMTGGFISIQRRLKTLPDEDLELLAASWAHVVLTPFSGGVLAVVLYCLFISGMVRGSLFPKFEVKGDAVDSSNSLARLLACQAVDFKDYAKLIVWAFVAGFSEKFVTNILGTFAASATSSTQSADEKGESRTEE